MATRLPTIAGDSGGLSRYLEEIRKFPMLEPGEEAERHPLSRTEFAVIALSLYEPSHLQQELCRFAR